MWLFTRYGFFSVACARKHGGRSSQPDSTLLMLRARQRHLENLRRRFPALAGCEVKADTGTDYAYRIIVAKATWSVVVAELVEEQTWSNFKDEGERFLGSGYRDYQEALHTVWDVMARLQEDERNDVR